MDSAYVICVVNPLYRLECHEMKVVKEKFTIMTVILILLLIIVELEIRKKMYEYIFLINWNVYGVVFTIMV